MSQVFDYFFGSYITPQEQRLRFVARNGVQHASEISPHDPLPGQPVKLSIITDAALPIDHVAVYCTSDGTEPGGERGLAAHGQVVLAELVAANDDQTVGDTPVCRWQAQLPGQPDGTLVRYRIDAWNSSDATARWIADADDPIAAPAPQGREFAYHVDCRRAPDWVNDAIVYHIFVDRFAAASDQPPLRDHGSLTEFYGGTIRGITEKLGYLSDLGVNCLWLSPVMDSPTYHGYNPTSYCEVAPRYGSNADLRELIAEAHARGMRVLLDFIANHTSSEHSAFLAARQAAQQGTALPDKEWYAFGPDYRNGYLAYFNVPDMPILQTDRAPVRGYLIEAARQWLTDFGADGLRLDNVSGPVHSFWTYFQEGLKDTNPDALTLGEVTGNLGDISTYEGRLDACMDFPWAKMTRRVFAQRDATLDELLGVIETHEAEFPSQMARARLLDNHDMHRFLWLAAGDTRRLKLALAFLMMMPGLPILYYGTEVGLSQRDGPLGKDAYAREPMLWGSNQRTDILEHTRWLIARRMERASLRRGQMARVPLALTSGVAGQVGALARWTEHEAAIVVLNNGDMPAQYSIEPHHLPLSRETGWGTDAPADATTEVEAWVLAPDGITPLKAPDLTGTIPPLSTIVILSQAKHAA